MWLQSAKEVVAEQRASFLNRTQTGLSVRQFINQTDYKFVRPFREVLLDCTTMLDVCGN
jgi:hypothetical protein